MVVCESIANYAMQGPIDLLVYPNTCVSWFWTLILGAIWAILAAAMYTSELKRFFTSEILSCISVAGIVTVFLGLIGTLITGSNNVPMVTDTGLITLLSVLIVFILVWLIKE